VLDLFPGRYVHLGGDECPKAAWARCGACRARMAAEGITDCNALQARPQLLSLRTCRGGSDQLGCADLVLACSRACLQTYCTDFICAAPNVLNHALTAPQTYFMERVARFVHARGRSVVGWDEVIEGGIPENAVVMSWRGSSSGVLAAQQGHRVVMCPNTRCYLDYRQAADASVRAAFVLSFLFFRLKAILCSQTRCYCN
jgi:hexosaminidase